MDTLRPVSAPIRANALFTPRIKALMPSMIKLMPPSNRSTMVFQIPRKIFLTPSHACRHFPVNTPETKVTMPVRI